MRTSPSRRRVRVGLATTAVLALSLTACADIGDDVTPPPTDDPGSSNQSLQDAAAAKAKEFAATYGADSGTVELMSASTGDEANAIERTYKAFEEATGIKVDFATTPDVNSVLRSRVESGNAPDVVQFQAGVMREYAARGLLLDLSDTLGQDVLESNFNVALLDSLSIDGKVYGTTVGLNPFMMWYNPEVYTGPTGSDATWDDIMDWSKDAAAAGDTPWCMAQYSQGTPGSSGAQFLEVLFAKKYGAEKLAAWGNGELPWTSPEVKDAWEMFGEIATHDAMVNGGVRGILSQPKPEGPAGMVTGGCQANLWATWVPTQVQSQTGNMQPLVNLDFQRTPASNPESFEVEIYQTDVIFAFSDAPAVKAFMAWQQSGEAQSLLASAGMWPVANINVTPETYPNALLQKVAEEFFRDPNVQLSAGPNVLNNSATTSTFWNGVMEYIADPSTLDDVLRKIDATIER